MGGGAAAGRGGLLAGTGGFRTHVAGGGRNLRPLVKTACIRGVRLPRLRKRRALGDGRGRPEKRTLFSGTAPFRQAGNGTDAAEICARAFGLYFCTAVVLAETAGTVRLRRGRFLCDQREGVLFFPVCSSGKAAYFLRELYKNGDAILHFCDERAKEIALREFPLSVCGSARTIAII